MQEAYKRSVLNRLTRREQMKIITEIKEYKGFKNKYLGKDIINTLGYRQYQDLITSGRIEKMNCRTSEGLSLYKYNQ